MALRVRALTDEEQATIERLAHSRTAPARAVERARISWHAAQGVTVPAIAAQLHLHEQTVRLWLKRFNAAGLDGLQDAPRSGRPTTYTSDQVSMLIATALTKPNRLALLFGSWTLDRLEAYLNEQCQIAIKRSRIDELVLAEGLRMIQLVNPRHPDEYVDLNAIAEWWLDLLRPIWYQVNIGARTSQLPGRHTSRQRRAGNLLRLKDLRNMLLHDPIPTSQLRQLFDRHMEGRSLAERVVATILGVP